MICAIFYLENPDNDIFADPKKHIEKYYVLNKAEYPRTVPAVHRLVLN